ncbi:MAG: dienelactone hydrolase family protein [Chloroflexi bacterium]|nr:dienelactone hydrolase family protein [Chloroflexota bacterium]
MRQSAVSFKTKGLTFEGVVAQPDGDSGPFPGIVICHPHPVFGGNMDNNVVIKVAYSLVEQGFATLRFNFRGVGNSEGHHSKGEFEAQEVLAALNLMKAWPGVDGRQLGLVGYSFGSSVILGNPSLHKRAKVFALISPPLRALESTELKKKKAPTLIISGDQDKLVQSNELEALLESFAQRPDCTIVPGADHFWAGYENELAPKVDRHFADHLK